MAGEIFISYRRADIAWARLLYDRLRAEGVEPWYDALVGAGEDWRGATARALQKSQIFVLLFSSNAARSTDIVKELAAAVHEKKLIVPVRLEDISPEGAFLYELASRNWINAFDDTEAKLADLAKGLAQMVQTGVQDDSALLVRHALPVSKRKPFFRPAILVAAALAVVASCAVAAWLMWPASKWTVDSSRPFISTLVPEDYPEFSPDGKSLAYASGDPGARKIYVRNLAGGDALKVSGDPYDDISPTWSSDGVRIAYVALKTGEPCRIMMVTVPAGQPRDVARCAQYLTSSKVTWQPGTPFLYYIDRVTPFATAIVQLDVDSGTRHEITGRKSGDYFADLRCSPDGKSLVYLKYDTTADLVIVRDLASGKELILGRITKAMSTQWPASAAWSEDSRTVLVAASGGSEIMAYPVDGGAAYRVYAAASAIGHLAVGHGGVLAFEVDASRTNLARATAAPSRQPDIIDATNGLSFSPSFAPDGTLAFLSNRSGTNAVWTMKPGAAPAILFDGGQLPLFLVDFSPDGSRLVVAYGTVQGVTYRILKANGASVATFETPDIAHGQPTWTADGKGLITTDIGGHYAVQVAIDNPANRRLFSPAPWEAVAVHAGGTYAVRHDKPNTVWRIDKAPTLISSRYDDHNWSPMTFHGDDILIPDFNAKGGPQILAQPLAGGGDHAAAYAPGAEIRGYLGKMAVEPKTGTIVYAATVVRDTNIDLLNLSRH